MRKTFSWKQRNIHEEELLDQPNIPAADLHRNMAELDTINRLLGGHEATLSGLKQLITDPTRTYTLVDVGCGGGDMLRIIHRWAMKRGLKLRLIGVDVEPHIIDYAQQHTPADLGITFLVADYRDLPRLNIEADVLITSLFLHHLFSDEPQQLVADMHRLARVGWVINDLHRHPLAYHSIKWLTRLFSNSYLVKHDAPLSVARGFNKAELQEICRAAGAPTAQVRWIWAFRWLIMGRK